MKVTQKMMAFYKLCMALKNMPNEFLNTWQFVGEIYIPELNKWEMMSYKCPTRLTEIFQENPGFLERRYITGKSGATYYQYRIAPGTSLTKITDPSLLSFYRIIKR